MGSQASLGTTAVYISWALGLMKSVADSIHVLYYNDKSLD